MIAGNQSETVRRLGEYEVTVDEAREDDNFRVLEIPTDMKTALTKTFTPDRFAKLVRDVAYFTPKVGTAPKKKTGTGDIADPGSGMRRSKEGALYNLRHREGLLKRAVDLNLIEITNENSFDDNEGEWTFSITERGKWFLTHYYGPHIPVRKVKKVKLSRTSSATNVNKIVVSDEAEDSIKSLEQWKEQTKSHEMGMGSIDSGLYHVPQSPVDAPETDPTGESLEYWIDKSDMPEQFDISAIDSDIHLLVNVEEYAKEYESTYDVTEVVFTYDEKSQTINIDGPASQTSVAVVEDGAGGIGIKGDYDPFVTSGAKDALKNNTDASYSDDYKRWYITPDEFLVGVEVMLKQSDINKISCPAHIVHKYAKYL